MQKIFVRQIYLVSFATVAMLGVLVAFWQELFTNHVPMCFLAASILTFGALELTAAYLIRAKQTKGETFLSQFVLMKSIKLLLALAAVVIYFLAIKINVKPFVISFAVVYLAYLATSTLFVSQVNKIESPKSGVKEI